MEINPPNYKDCTVSAGFCLVMLGEIYISGSSTFETVISRRSTLKCEVRNRL